MAIDWSKADLSRLGTEDAPMRGRRPYNPDTGKWEAEVPAWIGVDLTNTGAVKIETGQVQVSGNPQPASVFFMRPDGLRFGGLFPTGYYRNPGKGQFTLQVDGQSRTFRCYWNSPVSDPRPPEPPEPPGPPEPPEPPEPDPGVVSQIRAEQAKIRMATYRTEELLSKL